MSKAYKGKNSPIIVMCGSGCDQSACYVLIDLVLNKIYRGAKEIDISATLEHLRDQRCGAVANKVSALPGNARIWVPMERDLHFLIFYILIFKQIRNIEIERIR